MKPVTFVGNSLTRIKAFPMEARQNAGFQIERVQRGEDPDDWKPIKTIGSGVREIRISDISGQYRVVFVVNLKDAVYVLHAFKKKTRKTRKSDIDLARKRLTEIGG